MDGKSNDQTPANNGLEEQVKHLANAVEALTQKFDAIASNQSSMNTQNSQNQMPAFLNKWGNVLGIAIVVITTVGLYFFIPLKFESVNNRFDKLDNSVNAFQNKVDLQFGQVEKSISALSDTTKALRSDLWVFRNDFRYITFIQYSDKTEFEKSKLIRDRMRLLLTTGSERANQGY